MHLFQWGIPTDSGWQSTYLIIKMHVYPKGQLDFHLTTIEPLPQWFKLEVCGSTRTRGYTRPDPYPRVRVGSGRFFTGRVGYGYDAEMEPGLRVTGQRVTGSAIWVRVGSGRVGSLVKALTRLSDPDSCSVLWKIVGKV